MNARVLYFPSKLTCQPFVTNVKPYFMFDYIDCDMRVHHRIDPHFNQSGQKINASIFSVIALLPTSLNDVNMDVLSCRIQV